MQRQTLGDLFFLFFPAGREPSILRDHLVASFAPF